MAQESIKVILFTHGMVFVLANIQYNTKNLLRYWSNRMEVKIIGQMDNTIDHTFESANRVYDKNGISPTINTCGGGGLQPKVIEFKKIPCKLDKMPDGELTSIDNAKICDVDTPTASTVTARYHKGIGAHKDNMVMESYAIRMVRTEDGKKLRKAYEIGEIHHGFNEHRKAELRTDGCSNTLSTVQKDNYICEKIIVAMRGRNPDNPSDRTVGSPTEQRLEPNSQGICNALTSVQKDNMVLEISTDISDEKLSFLYLIDGYLYLIRIRKLTPRECWRLMDFTDEDFHKSEEVNSNTQLYKQAGNSICKNVLVAIFGQMLDGKEDVYKEINSTHFPNQQQ